MTSQPGSLSMKSTLTIYRQCFYFFFYAQHHECQMKRNKMTKRNNDWMLGSCSPRHPIIQHVHNKQNNSKVYIWKPSNVKGLDHNFTMFYQLKLFRRAQTPHPPSPILNEKTRFCGKTYWNCYTCFSILKWPDPPPPILKDLGWKNIVKLWSDP